MSSTYVGFLRRDLPPEIERHVWSFLEETRFLRRPRVVRQSTPCRFFDAYYGVSPIDTRTRAIVVESLYYVIMHSADVPPSEKRRLYHRVVRSMDVFMSDASARRAIRSAEDYRRLSIAAVASVCDALDVAYEDLIDRMNRLDVGTTLFDHVEACVTNEHLSNPKIVEAIDFLALHPLYGTLAPEILAPFVVMGALGKRPPLREKWERLRVKIERILTERYAHEEIYVENDGEAREDCEREARAYYSDSPTTHA